MRIHRLRLRACAGAICLSAALIGCGSGSDGPTPDTPKPTPPVVTKTGALSGLILDAETGAPIAAATVSVGALSASTDASGAFTLAEVPLGAALLNVSHGGHASQQRSAQVQQGQTTPVQLKLQRVGAVVEISASSGGSATVPNSTARVTLPAKGVQDSQGAAYTGAVAVELTPINPVIDTARMPGGYLAQPAPGSTTPQPMESWGALSVNLRDSKGQKLQLAPGSSAQIRIPLATRSAEVPGTIPLFYLNESTGLWVQEGEARLAGDGEQRYYEAQVSHFSTWNADRIYDAIRVRGCVADDKAQRKVGIDVFADGQDYSGRSHAFTDGKGNFEVLIRRGSIATLFAQSGDLMSRFVKAGPSATDIDLPECLVLAASSAAPSILTQPNDISSPLGWPVAFSVQAVGARALSYQWSRDGVAIPGATEAVYVFASTKASDETAKFSVKVSNEFGSVSSATASWHPSSLPAPVIRSQPASQQGAIGATLSFRVAASAGAAVLSYQWQLLRNGQWSDIAGATNDSYTTPALTAADNGLGVRVVVTANKQNLNSDTALISVAIPAAPVIKTQPRDTLAIEGQNVSFSVIAEANELAPISYQWQRNGVDITGATNATYQTPTLTASDNGASYRVLLSNSVGKLSSSVVTLTVKPASSGGAGYYLSAFAGTSAKGSTQYADGAESSVMASLLAIKADNPTLGASTVEPAGQVSNWNKQVVEATLNNGQLSAARQRFIVYFKGGRLYKLDHVVSSGVPTPALLSSLKSTDVCGRAGSSMTSAHLDGMGNDFIDASRSWVFLIAPGPDGRCDTAADNKAYAVRLNMDANTPAQLIDMPVAELRAQDGSLSGYLLRSGTQLSSVDANLASPKPLYKLDSDDFVNLSDGLLGSNAPGVWIYIDGSKLYGLDLAKPSSPKLLATLNSGEAKQGTVVTDGANAYLALSTASSARILHITEGLAVDTLATLDVPVSDMQLSPSHVIVQSLGIGSKKKGQLLSLARGNGAQTVLYTLADTEAFGQTEVSGSNVYASVLGFGATPGLRTWVSAVDGSAQAWLNNSLLLGVMGPRSWSLRALANQGSAWGLFLVDGVSSLSSIGGGTLRSVQGDNRQTLVSYGKLPDSQNIAGFTYVFNYGQPSLLNLFNSDAKTGTLTTDLLHFKSDAPGLSRITEFLSRSSGAPATARVAQLKRPRGTR